MNSVYNYWSTFSIDRVEISNNWMVQNKCSTSVASIRLASHWKLSPTVKVAVSKYHWKRTQVLLSENLAAPLHLPFAINCSIRGLWQCDGRQMCDKTSVTLNSMTNQPNWIAWLLATGIQIQQSDCQMIAAIRKKPTISCNRKWFYRRAMTMEWFNCEIQGQFGKSIKL